MTVSNMVYLVFEFLVGVTIGSFLNVCIYRIPRGESITYPPSHCPYCETRLGILDLIPVVSFIILRGCCRYCGTPISWQYPIVEILAGLFFTLTIGASFPPTLEDMLHAILSLICIVVTYIDFKYRIIPNKVVAAGLVLGLPLIILRGIPAVLDSAAGFLVLGLIFFTIIAISKGMGGGDLKFGALIGMYLGLRYGLMAILLSFIIGALAGIVLILSKKRSMKDTIPFGPFLALGTVITIFWGKELIHWYLTSFLW